MYVFRAYFGTHRWKEYYTWPTNRVKLKIIIKKKTHGFGRGFFLFNWQREKTFIHKTTLGRNQVYILISLNGAEDIITISRIQLLTGDECVFLGLLFGVGLPTRARHGPDSMNSLFVIVFFSWIVASKKIIGCDCNNKTNTGPRGSRVSALHKNEYANVWKMNYTTQVYVHGTSVSASETGRGDHRKKSDDSNGMAACNSVGNKCLDRSNNNAWPTQPATWL